MRFTLRVVSLSYVPEKFWLWSAPWNSASRQVTLGAREGAEELESLSLDLEVDVRGLARALETVCAHLLC